MLIINAAKYFDLNTPSREFGNAHSKNVNEDDFDEFDMMAANLDFNVYHNKKKSAASEIADYEDYLEDEGLTGPPLDDDNGSPSDDDEEEPEVRSIIYLVSCCILTVQHRC